MPLTYYDTKVREGVGSHHPALVLDKEHPCYKIVREAVDGKSVLHWNREQAIQMYNWYVDTYNYEDLVTEFGENIYSSDWKEIIQKSHYLDGGKGKVSDETIKDLFAAYQMEKKILESNGEEEEESDE